MSGGSMDYIHSRVAEIKFDQTTPLRKAFMAHLQLVANALRDIEWVDSGDCEEGTEEDAIRACLDPRAELEQIVEIAQYIYTQLDTIFGSDK